MDFFWWKTWELTSTKPKLLITEGLGEEVITPRVRAFTNQAYIEATGMTIDDLYESGAGTFGFNSKEVRMFQLRKLLNSVNKMNAAANSPQMTIVSMVPNPTGEAGPSFVEE